MFNSSLVPLKILWTSQFWNLFFGETAGMVLRFQQYGWVISGSASAQLSHLLPTLRAPARARLSGGVWSCLEYGTLQALQGEWLRWICVPIFCSKKSGQRSDFWQLWGGEFECQMLRKLSLTGGGGWLDGETRREKGGVGCCAWPLVAKLQLIRTEIERQIPWYPIARTSSLRAARATFWRSNSPRRNPRSGVSAVAWTLLCVSHLSGVGNCPILGILDITL